MTIDTAQGEQLALRAWARLSIDGVGLIEGEVVGFNRAIVVVAIAEAVRVPRDRVATISLGVDAEEAQGLLGTTMLAVTHADGRRCVAVALADDGELRQRTRIRVPFDTRVDAMVITSRTTSDHTYKYTAFDLSTKGIGVHGPREIPLRSEALLRFAVPPHRGTIVQVRGVVAYCRAVNPRSFQVGFEFDRVGRSQIQQLHAAVTHLANHS